MPIEVHVDVTEIITEIIYILYYKARRLEYTALGKFQIEFHMYDLLVWGYCFSLSTICSKMRMIIEFMEWLNEIMEKE